LKAFDGEKTRTECDQVVGTIKDLLHYCETMDFGKGALSTTERSFYQGFSNEILSLCRSLPESAQTDSVLLLMRYSGVHPGDELNFFANYYSPAWSVLYWLSRHHPLSAERLKEGEVTNAVTGQSMAMFLHSLDDHLIDGQVPVSPLTLLLRTQAWTTMNRAFRNLAESVPAGEEVVRGFVDDYYSSAQNSEGLRSLDSYCERFRKQMAIWMVAPILLSMKLTGVSDFTRDMEIAYGSFGIAWRLLDDIKDIAEDIERETESAIYLCLPERLRNLRQKCGVGIQGGGDDSVSTILNHVLERGIIETIKERICAELETAASIVETYDMGGLAEEFRCLADPLRTGGDM
jgi:hypothetical protein